MKQTTSMHNFTVIKSELHHSKMSSGNVKLMKQITDNPAE